MLTHKPTRPKPVLTDPKALVALQGDLPAAQRRIQEALQVVRKAEAMTEAAVRIEAEKRQDLELARRTLHQLELSIAFLEEINAGEPRALSA